MFGNNRLSKAVVGALFAIGGLVSVSTSAAAVEIPVTDVGFGLPGAPGTLVQSADLSLAGTPTINTIVLTDISGGNGGDPGVFSGYDLDAIVLDRDGDITTTGAGEQFTLASLGASLTFTGGTIRGGAGPFQVPDGFNNVGTYFGTNFGDGLINEAVATLNTFDGVNSADTLNADGFLSFGDGGELVITFADIAVGSGLFLLVGEVGGQGEAIRVDVPGQVPLPGAVWLFLSAIAVLFGLSRRRNAAAA